jgi:hypothetical protein
MITKKTVLILGAGASMDYGFPSGRELLEDIKAGISDMRKDLFRKLQDYEASPDKINDFFINLIHSDPLSIDAFLERRTEFIPLGKLAIVMMLYPKEIDNNLFEQGSLHWYQYLRNSLLKNSSSPEEFGNNKLAIITFNYDRSMEHYLYTVFQSTYNLYDDEKKCAEILRKIPIIHVYGSLGLLPWQENGMSRKPYGLRRKPSAMESLFNKTMIQTNGLPRRQALAKREAFDLHGKIKEASENIKIIPESEDTSKEFEKAIKHLKLAERIYFLGFGYHEANLRRLKKEEYKSKVPFGTCLGMGKRELNAIKGIYGSIRFAPPRVNILDFLRDYADLD